MRPNIRGLQQMDRIVSEQLVARLDSIHPSGLLRLSSDNRRIAFWTVSEKGPCVVVDGIQCTPHDEYYDDIDRMYRLVVFSPDSKRVAWAARVGDGNVDSVVVDGIQVGSYRGIVTWVIFSPDSRRVAYWAPDGLWDFVVIDGVASSKRYNFGYSHLREGPVFSPDSRHVAFAGRSGDHCFVVVDGAEQAKYKEVSGIVFSPDSQRVAYWAEKTETENTVVVGGCELSHHSDDTFFEPLFSPDGKRMAYTIRRDRTFFAVIDGTKGPPCASWPEITFSPDSRHVAYASLIGNKPSLVIDGVATSHARYEHIGTRIVFSHDSRRMVYAAQTGGKWFLNVDGVDDRSYVGVVIDSITFSPDSKHISYVAVAGNRWLTNTDGTEGRKYDGVRGSALVFSPGSEWLAYPARTRDQCLVVVGGSEGRRYDAIINDCIGHPLFHSPTCTAHAKNDEWILGKCGGQVFFSSPSKLHYFACKGNCVYLVEETLR